MMKLKYIILVFLISLFSCEQELEITLPTDNSLLSITSFFGPGTDTVQFIHLYASYPILEDKDPIDQIVDNATIRIYEDDILIGEPQYVEATSYLDFINIQPFVRGFYVLDTIEPKVGSSYSMEIEAEGFEPIYSTTSIPPKVSIIEAEIYPDIFTGVENVGNGEALEGKIVFQDPLGDNYYLFKVDVIVIQEGGFENIHESAQLILNNVELGFDDVDESGFEFYFRDVVFENQTYEINFLLANSQIINEIKNPGLIGYEKVEVSVVLQNLTPETYDYLISANLQEETTNDPFVQPVQIRSNIENGVGIFGGIHEDQKILGIDDILNATKD